MTGRVEAYIKITHLLHLGGCPRIGISSQERGILGQPSRSLRKSNQLTPGYAKTTRH